MQPGYVKRWQATVLSIGSFGLAPERVRETFLILTRLLKFTATRLMVPKGSHRSKNTGIL